MSGAIAWITNRFMPNRRWISPTTDDDQHDDAEPDREVPGGMPKSSPVTIGKKIGDRSRIIDSESMMQPKIR